MDDHEHDPIACNAAHASLVDEYRDVADERDRLRAVVAALRDFPAERDRIMQAYADGNTPSIGSTPAGRPPMDDEAAGVDAIVARVAALPAPMREQFLLKMYWRMADERDRLREDLDGANEHIADLKATHDSILGDLDAAEAERDRLRAALRAVMTETGTSTLAHHYARDALDGEATDGR